VTVWIIDKSALVRLGRSVEVDLWIERVERGLVRVSCVTLLEVGYSARSARELEAWRSRPPLSSMPVEYLTPRIEDRAVATQARMAELGHHRAPSVPDLLVAAIGELAEFIVLHNDKDFELIASVTGQPTERLAVG
jgi:predicted nucleic acid-binding protein